LDAAEETDSTLRPTTKGRVLEYVDANELNDRHCRCSVDARDFMIAGGGRESGVSVELVVAQEISLNS